MCVYKGHAYTCSHTCFYIHLFCGEILRQLNRINDPIQRETYDLPFDPDTPSCKPRYLVDDMERPVTSFSLNGGYSLEVTNVLSWHFNIEEVCPSCRYQGFQGM